MIGSLAVLLGTRIDLVEGSGAKVSTPAQHSGAASTTTSSSGASRPCRRPRRVAADELSSLADHGAHKRVGDRGVVGDPADTDERLATSAVVGSVKAGAIGMTTER